MAEAEWRTPGQIASPTVTILHMVTGSWVYQAIYMAAKLGIADLLKDGARSSHDLAEATGTHPCSLFRLLRALATLGVFATGENETFALTPLSQVLLTEAPGAMRATAMVHGGEHYRAWGNLLYSVKTGERGFDDEFQMTFFDHLAAHADANKLFREATAALTAVPSDGRGHGLRLFFPVERSSASGVARER